MPRNYRRPLPPTLAITDLQRNVWRWQWIVLSVGLALLIPLSIAIEALLPLLLPQGVESPIPPRQVSQISVFLPIGLMLALLGWLSVRYQVTLLARRIDFWRPTVGSSATLYGWIALLAGLGNILIAILTAWPILQVSPLALPLVGGALFVSIAFWLILRGLKRAFDERTQWN